MSADDATAHTEFSATPSMTLSMMINSTTVVTESETTNDNIFESDSTFDLCAEPVSNEKQIHTNDNDDDNSSLESIKSFHHAKSPDIPCKKSSIMRKSSKKKILAKSTMTEKFSTFTETTSSSTSKSQRTLLCVFKDKLSL